MKSIEEMIKELCPEGVEYVKLGEVCEILRGNRVTKKQILSEGLYPVISGGITPMGYLNESNRKANTITVSQYGTAGYVDFQDEDFWANDICYSLYPSNSLNNRFLWYSLKEQQDYLYSIRNTNATPYSLPVDTLKSVRIPLPPLPIQQQIADTLDKFTSLISNIDKEIELRQKQYEYYREKLYYNNMDEMLSAAEKGECRTSTFGEIGTIVRGKRFVRTDIVENGVPCIHYGDIYTYYGSSAKSAKTHLTKEKSEKMRFCKKNDIVIVGAGEDDWDIGVGLVWLGEENAAVHDACYIFSQNQNPMYISHFLRSFNYHRQLQRFVSDGKICSFSGKDLGKIIVPLPSLSRQQSIVSTLDKFEAVLANLKRERELRQKQYEYYREKLLTF